MTRKDIDTQQAPAAAGRLHSPRLPHPTATREYRTGRRQERPIQGKPMNTPWPNAKTHRLFRMLQRGCSQGQRLGLHPTPPPPYTPRTGKPAPVAMQITGGELRLAVVPLPVELATVTAAMGDAFTCQAWPDDAVRISRWRRRRTPVKPPCPVHRETTSQAPAHETARADAGLRAPGYRWVHAWGGSPRCAAGTPAPALTAAAREQAARITEAGMKADAFEGVV
ncbi:hypothetical protein ACFU7T_12890 [Streptomyces sp. NPDC057555]|uniref:hypothetical protein n=1 Tax=Streptomyces sp. NPDC057555 TaxID=3346166 RepID=UPI0036A7C5BC